MSTTLNEHLNLVRHQQLFNPADLEDQEIHVIGVGATGSRIALLLAELGIENLHLWDYDTVEAHNVPNQAYGLQHVGQLKVDAMAEIIGRDTKAKVITHNEKVDGTQHFEGYVFLLVDSLEARRQIYQGAVKLNPHIQAIMETRMGPFEGRVYIFKPINVKHARQWERSVTPTVPVLASACGTVPTIGSTATLIAGMAVNQLMIQLSLSESRKFLARLSTLIFLMVQP